MGCVCVCYLVFIIPLHTCDPKSDGGGGRHFAEYPCPVDCQTGIAGHSRAPLSPMCVGTLYTVYPCYNGPRYTGNLAIPDASQSQ